MTTEPDASPPTDPEQYFRAVEPTVEDAEKHLSVPHGTLADIRHDTDYLAIVKMHATIEPLLNEALRESVTRAMTHPKVHFPGGEAVADFILGGPLESKVRLALKNELVSDENARFIRAVARLRNHYAHNVRHLGQTIYQAAAEIDKQGEGIHLQRDLLGWSGASNKTGKATERIVLLLMRPFLFLRFAELLANLLQGIRPPPPLLGGLFGITSAPPAD